VLVGRGNFLYCALVDQPVTFVKKNLIRFACSLVIKSCNVLINAMFVRGNVNYN
jgi:hypothetical protein